MLDSPLRIARFAAVLSLGLFAATAVQAQGIQFNFSDVEESHIRITGNGSSATITFEPGLFGGPELSIDTVDHGDGSAVGKLGTFSGAFSFNLADIGGTPDHEEVLLHSTMSILLDDGVGNLLTADITDTTFSRDFSTTTINAHLTLNLENIIYSGALTDFVKFASFGKGVFELDFNLDTTTLTLADMAAEGFDETFGTYSGHINAVPEPASMLMMGLGALPVLGLAYRRRRQSAK